MALSTKGISFMKGRMIIKAGFVVGIGLGLYAGVSHSDVLYWNPTTVAKAPGTNSWDTTREAWAPTSSGTTTPGPWISGSTASFSLNDKRNLVEVNGPEVGAIRLSSGTYEFMQGSSPMVLAGPLTNSSANATFYTDITLSQDQNWVLTRDTPFYGTLTGPYTIHKMGANVLILSNAVNAVGGIALEDGTMRVFGGGSALGGADSVLTLGSDAQTKLSQIELHYMRDRNETEWSGGDICALGHGELAFKTSSNTTTHRAVFGDLVREGHGVVAFRQDWLDFQTRQTVTFANAESLVLNGILPPWAICSYGGDFAGYDGAVKTVTYKTTEPEMWTDTDVVLNNKTRTLEADTDVYALRATSDLTVPQGVTLTTGSGGLILSGKTLSGEGSVASGTDELLVYATGTSAIYPALQTRDLTVWGSGTLSISNFTWSGDTTIYQGKLKTIFADDTVLTGRTFAGYGEWVKSGAGDLTLVGASGCVGKLSFEGTGALTLRDSHLTAPNSLTITAPLTLQSSTLDLKGTISTGDNTDNVTIEIIGSGVPGERTFIDCHDKYVRIGINGGCHNTLLVDGNGVTEGASIEGISEPGSNGFGLGIYNHSAENLLRIIRGGCIRDFMPHNNRDNGIGLGEGSHSNRVEIIGGEGIVSRLYKAYPRSLGENGGWYNTLLIDGQGVPGSAVFESSSGRDLVVGMGNSQWNHVVITNGGQFLNGMVNVGSGSSNNRADIIGPGSAIIGDGGNSTFSFGSGNSSNNVLYVADGGEIRNLTKWSTGIGSAGSSDGGNAFNNQFILANGGKFTSRNGVNIGRKRGTTASSVQNGVTITGAGSLWDAGNIQIELGVSDQGSLSRANYLRLENRGIANAKSIRVGVMAYDTEGGISTENFLDVRDEGQLALTDLTQCGHINDTVASSNNQIRVSQGGLLETRRIVIGAPDNNTIRFTDRAVLQFTTTNPDITSLAEGDILFEDSVLSYRALNNLRVNDIAASQVDQMLWRGTNALRLTQAKTDSYGNQTYVFDKTEDPTHFARLEMVQNETAYLGQNGNTLTIGTHGEMLCSNTQARVELPFELLGSLRIFNSTLTLTKPATLQGTIHIDLEHLPENALALIAKDALTLGPDATISFSGKPVDGTDILSFENSLSGSFHIQGLPSNYRLCPGIHAPNTLTLCHVPTILYFR